jgi:nitrate/TMAO reductase-like tetraheme cytochrome c subunit
MSLVVDRRLLLLPTLCCVSIAACGDAPAFSSLDSFVAEYWIRPVPAQGPAPVEWPELEASLHPESCGSCHTQKLADWSTTIHAGAYSPGLSGQLVNWERTAPETVRGCLACHAPLAEQSAWTAGADGSLSPNPVFDPALRDRGITCAACHLRGRKRYGPLPRDGVAVTSGEDAPHDGATRTEYFSDSRFCAGCHQFEAPAPAGKSIQNTYEEWRTSRWADEGVSCQDCHMPDRRHLWRGIHDPEMVRSALSIEWQAGPGVGIRVRNSGAGHHFPTYVTPEVVVQISQLDAEKIALDDGSASWIIARKVENRSGVWVELSDTRIGVDEAVSFEVASLPGARFARATISVRPDAVYSSVFAQFLMGSLPDTSRVLLSKAAGIAGSSPFVIFDQTVPIPR